MIELNELLNKDALNVFNLSEDEKTHLLHELVIKSQILLRTAEKDGVISEQHIKEIILDEAFEINRN
jgi:DNA-directed RNA polymerase subunit H (RpoH/RPB5)